VARRGGGASYRGAAGRRRKTGLPTGVSVQITVPENLEQLVANSQAVKAHITDLTDRVAALADAQCPIDHDPTHGKPPGYLRRSQAHDVVDTPNGPVGVVGYFAFYAHMVHNGTSHSPPDPWLLNAAITVMQRSRGAWSEGQTGTPVARARRWLSRGRR
jgi:hypothetical protein